jgi:hypothetical protein
VKIRRDELGRFAKKVVPRRDDQGRFAKKKVVGRGSQDSKGQRGSLNTANSGPSGGSHKVPRKVVPHKVVPRKVVPHKVVPHKVVPRKVVPRKVVPRKVVPRKVVPRKVVPRKGVPRKVVPRKVVPRKVVPRKVVPRKVVPRKVVPRKVVPRKVVPHKVVPRKVVPRKVRLKKVRLKKKVRRRRKKKILPNIPARARRAEAEILAKLAGLMGMVGTMVEGSDVAVKSFINADGSVDGELKVAELPDELRSEEGAAELVATLSEVFRAFRPFPASPPMGGKFWVSFAMRFGPQNETEVGKLAEIYKRFRGLYQVGTYPAAAWHPTPIQLALATGLKTIVEGVARKQGFPPSVILIRFTWTPDGRRPGHVAGEGGGGK